MNTERSQGLSGDLTDVAECNREAIHLIPSIQSRGALLFFSWPDGRIQSASKNIAEILRSSDEMAGVSWADVLGAKLEHTLEPHWFEEIGARVGEHPWEPALGRSFRHRGELGTFDCYLFESGGLFGLEIERASPETPIEGDHARTRVTETLMGFQSGVKGARDASEVATLACRTVRALTGLDRVMLYRFLFPSWHGEVIGEDRVLQAHSYMGHRFPASDIPKPARDLYLRNKARVISNVHGDEIPLAPTENPLTRKPLDLSDSRLRSASKVHVEYLKNMGVGASLSFAITVKGELWGLIACHHFESFHMSQDQRIACELVAETVAGQAPLLETLESYRKRFTFESRLKHALEGLKLAKNSGEAILKGNAIAEIFNASGLALVNGESTDFSGLTPRPNGIAELAGRLQQEMRNLPRPVLAISRLHDRLPGLQFTDRLVAGVLAVKLEGEAMLMIFRPEVIKTITWGGDPVKQLDKKGLKGEINPRKSFETWKEVIKGSSLDWQPYEAEGAQSLASSLSFF